MTIPQPEPVTVVPPAAVWTVQVTIGDLAISADAATLADATAQVTAQLATVQAQLATVKVA